MYCLLKKRKKKKDAYIINMEFCITPTQQLKTYTRILLTNLVETGKHTMKTVSLLFTIPKLSDFILKCGNVT